MIIRYLSFLFLFFTFTSLSIAQSDWCATDEMLEKYLKESPQNRAKFEQQQQDLIKLSKTIQMDKTGPIIIPMVVHVIHDDGVGNISKEQIEDGIEILNKDLRKLNPDTSLVRSIFQPYMDDLNIEFRLAKLDPNGKCTEGITRTSSKETNSATPRNAVKNVKRWPYSSYFNVWLVNSINSSGSQGTVLGYAQFPGSGSLNNYGIVVRHDEWGSIGTAQGSNGRTVTHEIGHCLGLFHTFQSGCGNDCSNSGDYICDTPPALQATFGCNKNYNTCNNDNVGPSPYPANTPDMLENYMSYDDCQYMFTTGQKLRALAVLSNPNYPEIKDLFTQANLIATGTNNGYVPQTCAPIADIIREDLYRCVGQNISFYEDSYNATVTSWNWSFPGGTPSSSTDSLPIVSYSNPGVYNYSVTVSSAGGSDSITMFNSVIISDTNAEYSGSSYAESFENLTTFNNEWSIINEGGIAQWQHNAFSASDGSSSVWINNFIEGNVGQNDALISPSINLSLINDPVLKFDVAYKKRDSQSSDNLRIWYSSNCGRTWSMFYTAYPTTLQASNSPDQNFWFTPQSPSDWKEISIPIPSWIKTLSNVKLKFELNSGGGNNLYLDNIRIDSPVGLKEVESKATLQIYPNPTSSNFTLLLGLNESNNVQIEIKNLLGKTVKTISNKNFTADSYRFHVETDDLASGIYLINLKVGNENITRKLVVQ